MTKSKIRIGMLPIIIALLLIFIFDILFDFLPIVNISVDISSLTIILGLIITGIVFLCYFQRNISAKQHENEIQALLDDHKQFMQRLDHELKNPLSAIQTGIAYSSQLLDEIRQNDHEEPQNELSEVLDRIKNQAMRIGRLISDLRKISELETCQIEETDVNVNQLLQQLLENTNHFQKNGKRNVQLSIPIAPWELPVIKTDEDLLYIALSNLLNNAIKYSSQDEIIEIRANENRNAVIVEVADRGIGIPQDEISSVWKKLYRAHNAKKVDGNGLGLSMVQTIVMRLGGEIDLRSTEGVGTVISIQLPKISAA